jgi:hypothetical protein
MSRQKRSIKNRRVSWHAITVPMGGRTSKVIYVTDKQLARLNAVPVGKEVFLSNAYCMIGSGWVIRTVDGLQHMPFPSGASRDEDVCLLENMMKD